MNADESTLSTVIDCTFVPGDRYEALWIGDLNDPIVSNISFDPGDPALPGRPPVGMAVLVYAAAWDTSQGFGDTGMMNPGFLTASGCSEPNNRKPFPNDYVLLVKTYKKPAQPGQLPTEVQTQRSLFETFSLGKMPDCSGDSFK